MTCSPAASRAAATSSPRVSMMPEQRNTPSSFSSRGTTGARGMMTSATMFASTRSAFSCASSLTRDWSASTLPAKNRQRSFPMPLRAAFSYATSTALGSMSTPVANRATRHRAAMARIPLPQPRSSTRSLGFVWASTPSRQSCVEAWEPVPNVRPGFISSRVTPAGISAVSRSHSGTMYSFSPTARGR